MFAKDEMKRSRMVKMPTSVLFVRDWTILLETLCKTTGKSLNTKRKIGKRVNTFSDVS